jgi:arsenate reductase (thioredoxin)
MMRVIGVHEDDRLASPFNVLFLCTGNSARSILAEALANYQLISGGKFTAFSAGSHPKGEVHPMAIDVLNEQRIPVDGLRSKSWDVFAAADAPRMNFVITVCDQAAGEVCPVWPGQPMVAHWGVPDPAAASGSVDEQRRAFKDAFLTLKRRVELFASLPIDKLSRLALQEQLTRIGSVRSESVHPHP